MSGKIFFLSTRGNYANNDLSIIIIYNEYNK